MWYWFIYKLNGHNVGCCNVCSDGIKEARGKIQDLGIEPTHDDFEGLSITAPIIEPDKLVPINEIKDRKDIDFYTLGLEEIIENSKEDKSAKTNK